MPICVLEIADETNVKIKGLDLDTRKKLVAKFKFDVPGARYLPAVRLGRWDGKVSFVQLSGSTYINLLPQILPMLEAAGYDVEVEDTRDYVTQFEFDSITEDSFAHINWPAKHAAEGTPIVLRDYQVAAVNQFLSTPQCINVLATGSGKTLITAAMSYSVQKHGRSIIIVPNKTLVVQTESDYKNLGLDVGVYFGDRKEIGRTHTICTWQSLNVILKNTKSGEGDTISIGEFIEDVVCVIVDEAHSCKASALQTLLTGAMAKIPLRWGLTGTIPKEQHAALTLTCTLGPVVGYLGASQLQDIGVLANCKINICQLVDHVEFRDYPSELKYLLTNEDRLKHIASMINQIKDTGNTLVLMDRVEPGKILAELIPDSVFISGATKLTERRSEFDEIADNDNRVLIATYGIAAVGINIVRIHNLILIEPGKSFVRVIQSIGRGLRVGHDKDHVEIYDITSTCKFAKRHLTKRKEFYKEANYEFNVQKINYIK